MGISAGAQGTRQRPKINLADVTKRKKGQQFGFSVNPIEAAANVDPKQVKKPTMSNTGGFNNALAFIMQGSVGDKFRQMPVPGKAPAGREGPGAVQARAQAEGRKAAGRRKKKQSGASGLAGTIRTSGLGVPTGGGNIRAQRLLGF